MATNELHDDRVAAAYATGRNVGIGISAVALGCVAFLSLLGVEKALLAIVLGILAIRGGGPRTLARRLGATAVGLGSLFLVTAAILLTFFWDELVTQVEMLIRLS